MLNQFKIIRFDTLTGNTEHYVNNMKDSPSIVRDIEFVIENNNISSDVINSKKHEDESIQQYDFVGVAG